MLPSNPTFLELGCPWRVRGSCCRCRETPRASTARAPTLNGPVFRLELLSAYDAVEDIAATEFRLRSFDRCGWIRGRMSKYWRCSKAAMSSSRGSSNGTNWGTRRLFLPRGITPKPPSSIETTWDCTSGMLPTPAPIKVARQADRQELLRAHNNPTKASSILHHNNKWLRHNKTDFQSMGQQPMRRLRAHCRAGIVTYS